MGNKASYNLHVAPLIVLNFGIYSYFLFLIKLKLESKYLVFDLRTVTAELDS